MSVADRIASLSPEQRALFEKLLEKKQKAARSAAPPPIPRVSGPTGAGDWPLSLDQERFWFMEQLYPGGAGLNIPAATRMRGRLSVPVLAAALGAVARRHAAWRATFPEVDGKPVQRVTAPWDLPPQRLAVIDLSDLPAARREPESARLVMADVAAPFDLARGPLVRSNLVRLDPEDHLCLLTVHHLATDFLAFQIAWAELAVLYDAMAAGRYPKPTELPEPPVQYPDFAVWQRSWLTGEVLDGLTGWWREQLAGVPRSLDLPTDRPRPATARLRGGKRAVAAPRTLAEGLRALGREEGATLFMTVLAATAALFRRLQGPVGQERLILGANNANRNRPEIEPVVGCFLTQVPFPIDLTGDPTFRELLARTRQSALGAYAHQDLPFGQLVQALQIPRDPSRQPLVQALVQVLDGQALQTQLQGARFEPIDTYDGKARYDVMLTLFDASEGLAGPFEYDSDLFDATTVERWAELLLLQAAAVVADPDLRLSALPALSAAGRHQVLAEWNEDVAVPAGFPGWTAPERFARAAARAPEATAVIAGGETLTYGDLGRRSTELALRLRQLGVERESRVALLLGRTADLPVAILAAWKAGAAYVPLDAESPAERLAGLLADAEPAVVLHRGPLRAGVVPEGLEARYLDLAELGDAPSGSLPLATPPSDLAYLIYTSGTTGTPKAVMVEHGNLAAMLDSFLLRYALGPGDRVPHFSRSTFDLSLLEVVAPLLAGGTIEILSADEVLDPAAALAALARSTRFFAVPAFLRQLAAGARELGPERFSSLRTITAGGELVPPALQTEVLATFPAAELEIIYGPTETTILCTIDRAERGRVHRTTIGRPLPGVEARIVDAQGAPVPMGVPGELWVGGPGVARGYLRRPELTAERFVTLGGRRFYRTGDLVRQLPGEGGVLEFLGRTDHQVKVRGHRIEPGEVEAALARHPAVRESVVVASPGPGGERQLVAYVVAPDSAADLPEDLRAFLRTLLPEPMVPSVFVPLPALPLSPNGKVDRKALPDPAAALADASDLAAPAAPPRNEREELLAEIWRGVLGRERVGIHDNFFQLGGDSILSIQVVARARQAGLVLTPRQIFEHQTIAELAALTAGETGAAPTAEEQGPIEGEVPLTPVEHRFFAVPRREPGRFNQALLLEVRETLAAAPLSAALARLARHHDALRLRFLHEADGWRQLHAPVSDSVAPLCEIEISCLPAAAQSPALEAAAESLQHGLDLARGPLFTAALFRRSGAADRLLLTAHHLIVDGVSWRVLLEDLVSAYRGLALPSKTTSWKRWAELLTAYATSPELSAELPYWLSLPATIPPLPVDLSGEGEGRPGDRARTERSCLSPEGEFEHRPQPGPQGGPGRATVSVELGAAETRALLEQAPEAYRTQVNDLLLAALARAFATWTGERLLLVDLEGHGREEIFPGVDLSRTIGWFTTVFPVALALPSTDDPGAAIRAVKEQLRAVPQRGLGFGVLRYLTDPATRERLAALPAPQVSFNYLGQLDPSLGQGALFTLAPEPVRGSEGEEVPGQASFAIDAMVLDSRLRVNWSYDPGRHEEATAEWLARGFLAEIETLVEHCRSPHAGGFTPSDFPLAHLDQAALDRVLGSVEWREVEDLYPLTPLQQGILFHSVHAGGAEIYFEQMAAELDGPLDVSALMRSWQRVVDRHTALRTAFLWRGLDTPLQLVRRHAELPWSVEDWRALPAAALPHLFDERLAADRTRGFDFARPPLTRLTLVRTGESHHRLIWSFHHVLLDGWCFALILTEVFTLYQAEVAGREAFLPRPRPYRDYIAWLLARGDESEAEAYWRQTLAGFTAPTPIPFDHPIAPEGHRADDFREHRLPLSAPLAADLASLAQRLRVTQNTLLEAAWALLLAHYAGLSDVVFGAVVSGRPADLPGVESMVGLFINTLPVRVQIPEEDTGAWLARLQANRQDLYQFQWSPLPRVQTLAEVPAGAPLFNSLLVFENYPLSPASSAADPALGGLQIGEISGSERTNYPLTLIVAARGELTLRLVADRRIEPVTGRRLVGQLEAVLEALVADPARPPLTLPLSTAAERHQMTVEWNDTAPVALPALCLHDLFSAQAARTPDATAVVDAARRFTYRELDELSNRLAWRLRRLGVQPEARVGLCLGRSGRMVAAMLAVQKAGGAYVGLDPRYPLERLAFMLADSGAVAVIAEESLLPALPENGLPVVLLDGDPSLDGESAAAPPPAAGPGNLAYLVYTSGSTGQPKGVAIEHASAVALALWAREVFSPEELRGVLAATSICFDLSVFEIFVPLAWGGTVIVTENALALPEHPAAAEVTLVNTVPSAMAELARAEALPPGAATINLAGEALTRELVDAVYRQPGVHRVVNLYGPSEDTTYSTWAAIPQDARAPAIGRPIAGTRAHVLDSRLAATPLGAPGELCLAGSGLARGYLGRPERTAESFVPDPFSVGGGERLYRTGDLARLRPDGALEYLGRIDQQVKIRGFRIEPGEIEAVLAAHPGVREAAVLARRDGGVEPRLVAYVVAQGTVEEGLDTSDLLAFLAARLPAYMVPTAFVPLDALPRTENGKLDRAALPAPERLGQLAATFVAPATPLEEILVRTTEELLGVSSVGMRDNFFALGGHSLLATQLVSRLTQDHGVEVTVQMVFDAKDLGTLADRIVEQELASADAALLAEALREMEGLGEE